MVQVRFIKFGANSAFGGFAPGDMLRCSEALAKHLVEEVGCAQYAETKTEPAPAAESEPKPRRRAK